MTDATAPEPQRNRVARRAESRRLRKTGAALATLPAALGTTALLLGATAAPAGAATLTVNSLGDAGDGTCDVSPGECTLRDALDDAADGDTIVFATNLTGTITLGSRIDIDAAVTITGPGATEIYLDGNSNDQIFRIDTPSANQLVTISGLTFQNAIGSEGGAIAISGDDDVTITGSVFRDNEADYGGAIYADDASVDLTISGSTFSNNYAEYYGGAIALANSNTLTITGSTFTGNTAGEYEGGAIYVEAAAGDVRIIDSTFDGNYAEEEGGAIALNSITGDVLISGSTFTDNSAGSDGGAIQIDGAGSITIENSTFTGNSSANDGGAIYLDDDTSLAIVGSTFTDNTANDDGGAVTLDDGTVLTITGSTFSDNTSYSDGGALYVEQNTLEVSITGSVFTGNQAVYNGGAIAVDIAASFAMTDSTVSGNTVGGGEDAAYLGGGGIYIGTVYGTAAITSSTISGNSAEGLGGGIFVDSVYGGVTVANSTISGNTAGVGGGGIFVDAVYVDEGFETSGITLEQSTVTANSGGEAGGVLLAAIPEIMSTATGGDQEAPEDVNAKHPEKAEPAEAEEPPVRAAALAGEGTIVLDGTIVALNAGSDIGSLGLPGFLLPTSSLFGAVSGLTIADQGGNLQNADPLLGPLQDNGGPTQTHALLDGSPAINAGPDPVADFPGNTDDQRGPGYPRVVGGRVDIGAFEVQPTNIEPTFTG